MTEKDTLSEALPRAVEAANKIRDFISERVDELPNHNVQLSFCVLLVVAIQNELRLSGQCHCKSCLKDELLQDWVPILGLVANGVGIATLEELKAIHRGQH